MFVSVTMKGDVIVILKEGTKGVPYIVIEQTNILK